MYFQRIYVDSRDREVGGNANGFDYMLPNNIVVPEESIAVLDSVLIPNSLYSVEKIQERPHLHLGGRKKYGPLQDCHSGTGLLRCGFLSDCRGYRSQCRRCAG